MDLMDGLNRKNRYAQTTREAEIELEHLWKKWPNKHQLFFPYSIIVRLKVQINLLPTDVHKPSMPGLTPATSISNIAK